MPVTARDSKREEKPSIGDLSCRSNREWPFHELKARIFNLPNACTNETSCDPFSGLGEKIPLRHNVTTTALRRLRSSSLTTERTNNTSANTMRDATRTQNGLRRSCTIAD